jgi:hypothetical protein
MVRKVVTGFALVAVSAGSLGAQVVRGRVTEAGSSVPIAGALVSLLGEREGSSLVSVLTELSGEYAVRAPSIGRYRLAVKRIGVKRFVSAPFDLGSGETRVLDVPIDAVALTLPQVTVSGLCVTRSRELSRVSSLWDEARTALYAAEISIRDRLIEAQISRYAGELQPGSLRVMFDWRSDAQVMTEQPFTSMSGDSLSAIGYWRQLPGDSLEYLAPDAGALASNAFLRDHCFTIANPPASRRDLIGLAFIPARDRRLADISGTIWLDAKLFELRFVEFRYTKLPPIPNADQIGGEVHFARLASGAWIVDRWFIRMPQVVVPSDDWPRRQLREEGGAVTAKGMSSTIRPGSVSGVYRDSAGKPEAGAVIRAIGTNRQVVTGADGSFKLDSLPPGGVSVVAHAIGYDAMAVLAASRRLAIRPGRAERLDLRAPNAGTLRREFCPNVQVGFGPRRGVRGVMRLLMVDSASAVPLQGIRFVVSWPLTTDSTVTRQEQYRQAATDSRGAATFCDLPIRDLEVSVLGPTGGRTHVMMTRSDLTGVVAHVIFGRLNR